MAQVTREFGQSIEFDRVVFALPKINGTKWDNKNFMQDVIEKLSKLHWLKSSTKCL